MQHKSLQSLTNCLWQLCPLSTQLCLLLWSKGLGAGEQQGNQLSEWVKAIWFRLCVVFWLHLDGDGKVAGQAGYKFLKGRCNEDRARFFLVMSSDGTRGRRHWNTGGSV